MTHSFETYGYRSFNLSGIFFSQQNKVWLAWGKRSQHPYLPKWKDSPSDWCWFPVLVYGWTKMWTFALDAHRENPSAFPFIICKLLEMQLIIYLVVTHPVVPLSNPPMWITRCTPILEALNFPTNTCFQFCISATVGRAPYRSILPIINISRVTVYFTDALDRFKSLPWS